MNYKKIFDVNNKIVLITGVSQGNGLALLEGFLGCGAKVIGLDVNMGHHIDNDDFTYYQCDLSEDDQVISVINKIKRLFKKIDVLINNAGITKKRNKEKEMEIWDQTFSVNLRAPFLLSMKASEIMKAGSSIINITSLASLAGFPDNPSYVSSKGGLRMLSKALSIDLSSKGIRVNNVLPGYIKTSMTEKSFSSSSLKKERDERIIMKRWGESEDLIGPCIFLASSASEYMTGSDVVVDGGWLTKGL